MNVYALKSRHEDAFPRSHFFDRDTLKFFGESLSRMSVLQKTVKIKAYSGKVHDCYVLSKQSRDFFGKRIRTYAYFDTTTFEEVLPA